MLKVKALVLTFILLLPTLMKVGVIGKYLFNYNEYATELCINIDKPELSCNGKCQMMEELNQVEDGSEKESKETAPLISIKELPATHNESEYNFQFISSPQIKVFANFTSNILKGTIKGVFHPPKI